MCVCTVVVVVGQYRAREFREDVEELKRRGGGRFVGAGRVLSVRAVSQWEGL